MQLQKAEKTALLFGATGLVGGQCLEMLLESPLYNEVRVSVGLLIILHVSAHRAS